MEQTNKRNNDVVYYKLLTTYVDDKRQREAAVERDVDREEYITPEIEFQMTTKPSKHGIYFLHVGLIVLTLTKSPIKFSPS